MGRMKIKKKESIMPFRQTMAYRMLLLTASILFCGFMLYDAGIQMAANNTLPFIIAVIVAGAAAIAVFYNLDHLRSAKIPAATAKRMKRKM